MTSLHKPTKNTTVSKFKSVYFLFIGLILSAGAAGWGGYEYALWKVRGHYTALISTSSIEPTVVSLKEPSVTATEQQIEILTSHLGRIEANLMRINALGERLVESAELSPDEFNFHQEVGVGGLLTEQDIQEDLLSTFKAFDAILEKRYAQFMALQQVLQTHVGKKELSFSGAGRAVAKGWISSFFGFRHDPFTGRKAWHSGVDIAGKPGSDIKALASGVVSYSASKGGYGRLVEINHGNGLATRYGHAQQLLVKQGQLVRKGDTIALLGSSGRSTGPHLHLEVHKDGKAVDPGLYFPDLRRR